MKSVKPQLKIKNIYFAFFVVVFSFSLLVFRSAPAEAARLFFDAPTQEPVGGQELNVTLMLDAQGQVINALEGVVKFPAEFLELKQLNDGESLVSLWIKRPEETTSGTVVFSGIIPSGFQGVLGPGWSGYRPGPVLRLVLAVKKEGRGGIEVKGGKVLLHDGRGTPAPLTTDDLTLTISVLGAMPPALPSGRQVSGEVADREPPEPFEPLLGRSPHLFDNQWFISFAAQDKQLGVARFEVQENRKQKIENRRWEIAESPYVLKDQGLRSFIYVKAVDQNGNEKVAVVPPRFPRAWYGRPGLWSIIIILGALGAFWLFRRRSEKRKAQNAKDSTQN